MDRKEYLELAAELRRHSDLYYNQDAPEISDYAYDAMMQRLIAAEQEHPEWITPDSPTQRVGGNQGKSSFEKVRHLAPMLSLQDKFTEAEVQAFADGFASERFSVEEKIDGLSMSVTYRDGLLVQAETRGDGYIGEDITENARQILGVPGKLLEAPALDNLAELEVRCEVYLPVEEFQRINAENEEKGIPGTRPPGCCAPRSSPRCRLPGCTPLPSMCSGTPCGTLPCRSAPPFPGSPARKPPDTATAGICGRSPAWASTRSPPLKPALMAWRRRSGPSARDGANSPTGSTAPL